jgi:hypothetical protein
MPPTSGAESSTRRCGGGFSSISTAAAVPGSRLPDRGYHVTRAQRQESTNNRTAKKVSTSESTVTPRLVAVAGERAAHHVVGTERAHSLEHVESLALQCPEARLGRRLMASRATIWSGWFSTTSRRAPTVS